MYGEVNMTPTLRKLRGGPVEGFMGGASLETFSGEAQLKKSPCISYSYFCQNLGQKPLPLPANGVLVEKIHFFAYFWVKNASKSKFWGLPEACHISFFRYISVIHIFAKIWVENHCH